MKKIFIPLAALICTLNANAAEPFPEDIQTFLKRREACEHFRGEVPESPEKGQMARINRQLKRYCKGTDDALAALRAKYAGNPLIMERLDKYESRIEARDK